MAHSGGGGQWGWIEGGMSLRPEDFLGLSKLEEEGTGAMLVALALGERSHELRRTLYVGGIDPSSRATLKTQPPIEGTEDFLHFRREHLEWLTVAIASRHADAYCLR